tara:strand:- start:235 stop:510 length:276 start_codon:yes stop_codon:yes gene_type:complete
MIIRNFTNAEERVDEIGGNINVGDIITWWQEKIKEQKFGIVTKKNIKSLKIKLLNKEINNHDIILTEINDIDNTCYNTLNYTRKLMILNLN